MAGRPKRRTKMKAALAVQPAPADFKAFEAAGVKVGVDSRAMRQIVARLQNRSEMADGGRLKLWSSPSESVHRYC